MKQPALFLDRDGVINVEKNYVHRLEDFEFLPGIFDLCNLMQEAGFALIVVTNQAGIGRGYYTQADFNQLTQWMEREFTLRGIKILSTFHCPHHPEHGIGDYHRDCFDRKPNPGMLLRARDTYDIDLADSVMLGDRATDMKAAARAGIPTRIWLSAATDTYVAESTAQVSSHREAMVYLRDWLQNRKIRWQKQ